MCMSLRSVGMGGTSKLSKISRRAKERRKSVTESLDRKPKGGATTYAAKLMAAPLGGTETICTITHYCRTTVFEFPGCHAKGVDTIPCLVICENEAFRAAVVSDLPGYFRLNNSEFPHYAIDVSLRDGLDRAYRKERSQRKAGDPPIFLVTEQYESVPVTRFDNGECFLIDERRDGEKLIEGGREGERALLAFRTVDGAWPDFAGNQHAVNTVLAAVKVEQNVTHHITELYSCSCFVSDSGRAVYAVYPTMSIGYGSPRVVSAVNTKSLREKVARIRSIHDGLRRDSTTTPQVAELIDSILLDNTQDDGHFRLWYLRLWQAAVDAKRLLGQARFEEDTTAIAGKLTPKQLKDYRNRIAHWWTGKVDLSFVTGIQQTVQELLRRKYRKQESERAQAARDRQ